MRFDVFDIEFDVSFVVEGLVGLRLRLCCNAFLLVKSVRGLNVFMT